MESTTGESEKRLLASVLKERLIADKNTIIYKELLECEMPLFLNNFLQNRVQKYFHTDEPFQIKSSKRYDFSYQQITQLRQQLIKAFEEATLFTKEEMTEIIERTVGLQFDLLINPHDTLSKIFYKNKSERTQKEILKILTELIDSRIYIKKLIENIRNFDQYHIVADEFIKLSSQTQQEIYHNDFLNAFTSDVKSFLDFMGHIKGNNEKTIKKEILKLLLTERKLDSYCQAFDERDNNNEWLDISDVTTCLKKYLNKPDSDEESYIQGVDDEIEDFIVSVVETENAQDDTQETVTKEAKVNTEACPQIKKHFPKILENKEPQDFIIDRNRIEYQPEGPFLSLVSLIDEKSKKLIQRKIFDKDEIAYANFINRLDQIDNWKEAKQIIEEELIFRAVQPFSREALRLGDLVFNRYFPKKKE